MMPPELHRDDIKFVQVFREIKESVVIISWRKNSSSEGTRGAGVIVKEEGIIATNNHVIEGADDSEIRVTFIDKSHKATYRKVRVLDRDGDRDIAVLKVNDPREKLRPISVGDSDSLLEGQTVYVVGHPDDLDYSFAAGHISGVVRTVESDVTKVDMKGMIQINVCISSGSSGGPVVDSWRKLVGIISGDSSPGHTFAIPVKAVMEMVERSANGTTPTPNLRIEPPPRRRVKRCRAKSATGTTLTPNLRIESPPYHLVKGCFDIPNSANRDEVCAEAKLEHPGHFHHDRNVIQATLEHPGHFHHDPNDVVRYISLEVSPDKDMGFMILWKLRSQGVATMPSGAVLVCHGICKECDKLHVDILPCDQVGKPGLDHIHPTLLDLDKWKELRSALCDEYSQQSRRSISGLKDADTFTFNDIVDQWDTQEDGLVKTILAHLRKPACTTSFS